MAQSKVRAYYMPVDIDSLLNAPLLLPQGKYYKIKKIEFSISTDKIVDVGATGGVSRDRFLQLNELLPAGKQWQYRHGCVTFKCGDHIFSLVFSSSGQADKIFNLSENHSRKLRDIKELHINKELIIKAKMLVGKFERYDTTRDFQLVDFRVNEK